MSIRRRISCASTSASGSARRAAACSSRTRNWRRRWPSAKPPTRGAPITVFEIETAAAFLLFARHPADVLLLEVGLGGRLDATNVIEHPLATRDHAGVARSCRVSRRHARQDRRREGRHPQARRAGDRGGAAARGARRDRAAGGAPERADPHRRRGLDGDRGARPPRLSGRRRAARPAGAETAMAAISSRMPASRSRRCARAASSCLPAAFETGIAKADWPARMQRLSQGRLAALAPPGSELWLDGGHNADGGRAIANALADLEERVSRPLVLVVGMLATKDSAAFLKNFSGLAAAWSRCRSRSRRSRCPRKRSPIPRARSGCRHTPAATSRRRSPPSPASISTRRRAS